jgi:hypothetical protein
MLISGDGVAIAQLLDVVIRQENTRFADKLRRSTNFLAAVCSAAPSATRYEFKSADDSQRLPHS